MFRNLLGFRKPPDEVLKKNLRELERAIRKLKLESSKFESQEKSQLAELKRCIKEGKTVCVVGIQ